MKTIKSIKYALLLCCVLFVGQAWSQTTRSLTVEGHLIFEGRESSLEVILANIKVYKGATLLENTAVHFGKDDDGFVRYYSDNDYPTKVEITVGCLPGMSISFNGMQIFYEYHTVCNYNNTFALSSGNNKIDIFCL